jgi:hypothetical protein
MSARSDRRQSTAKHRTKSATRSLSLYDGTTLIGTIKIGSRGNAVAYNVTGKRIGSFRSVLEAKVAFK